MKMSRSDNWALGANNIDPVDRLPDGHVRQLINLNPTSGGQLALRTGYKQVLDASNMRLAVALSGRVIFVDGAQLSCYDIGSNSAQALASLTVGGDLAGVAFNGQVYICGLQTSVRTDGEAVKPWSIPTPSFRVEIIGGKLPEGVYKVAVTAQGDDGEESGADPAIVRLDGKQAMRVVSEDARLLKLYASVANGATLYNQGPLVGGAMAISQVDDYREPLTTAGLVAMPTCTQLAAYHGVILGIYDRAVVFSTPLCPHLMDPISGYFQYSEAPCLIAPTDGGVYVVADKTYFITDLESDTPVQRVVLDVDAVAGSAVLLPDGRAAWFTRYGQAIGNAAGEVSLPNRKTYAPDMAAQGAAGVVDCHGQPLIVTTMRGLAQPNNMATGDFASLEIGNV